MNLTVLTLIGLATLGQPGDDYFPSNEPTITLGIDYTPDMKEKIAQTGLFVSTDKGQLWNIAATAFPDETEFNYTAPTDGLYCFVMIIYFKDGTQQPKAPGDAKPEDIQCILFDTTPPTARIVNASRSGETVKIEWSVEDQYPDESATKVRYKLLGGTGYNDWQPVAGLVPGSRFAEFKTTHPGSIAIEVEVVDQAGNAVKLERELPAVQTAEAVTDTAVSLSPPMESVPEIQPTVPDLQSDVKEPTAIKLPDTMLQPTAGTQDPPLLTPPPVLNKTPSEEVKPAPVPMELHQPRTLPPAPGPRMQPNSSTNDVALPPLGSAEQPWPTEPPQPMAPAGPKVIATASDTPPPSDNDAEYINFAAFELQYSVDPGPSGLRQIDLYVTRDDGRSWTKWSQHDGREMPLRVQLATRNDPTPQGNYGLRMVPISGAGLSVGVPPPGTSPQYRVHVDTTKPSIRVFEPTPDPNNRNTLVLQWEAKDVNFGRDPILIEYSPQPTGPWQSVTAGEQLGSFTPPRESAANRIPNSGSYPWPLPNTLTTHSVYLKFSAWDKANNMSEVITPRPILVDLTRPQATIQGILPGGNYPDSPSITPLPGTIPPPSYNTGYPYQGGVPRR